MLKNNLEATLRYKLIVTIVKKGLASRIVTETKKAGADGGTIILGNGTAKKSVYLDLLGINFDPEKEVILTIADENKADNIINEINSIAKLNKPGNGICFVINAKNLTGVIHLFNQQQEQE